jgi:hypothetical protein
MIKFSELKVGDFVIADNDGDSKRGEITNLNGDEKQACVDTGQEFWYEKEQLYPIPLSDKELMDLQFHKQVNADGTVKYSKGAFRLLIAKEADFSHMELWYRDETRHITHEINVHNLQNHFYEMTKVHLNDESFD